MERRESRAFKDETFEATAVAVLSVAARNSIYTTARRNDGDI